MVNPPYMVNNNNNIWLIMDYIIKIMVNNG